MIELNNVSFGYAKSPVVRNCTAAFTLGELCAVIGPNGSGKSTLLRLLSGQLRPQNGQILLRGKEIGRFAPKELAREIGMMPQTRIVPEMTVREYVEHARFPYLPFSQKLSQTDIAAVEHALIRTALTGFGHRPLRELSGGERQRAYLALLLAQDTPCALLDEPTTFLDISTQFAVLSVLRDMANSGKCVVAVLHDLSLAMQFCDRIIVMHNGEIRADDAPDALCESTIWQEVFGVRCHRAAIEHNMQYLFLPA